MTGWSHLSIHDNAVGVFNCGEADHQGVGNLLFDNQALKAAVSKRDLVETVFVVERFIMNAKITQQPYSLETIGLIRYFVIHNQITLEMVSPSSHKNLISNDVIKRAGLWVPSSGGHQMDAVRIALWYLITRKGLLKECLKAS